MFWILLRRLLFMPPTHVIRFAIVLNSSTLLNLDQAQGTEGIPHLEIAASEAQQNPGKTARVPNLRRPFRLRGLCIFRQSCG